MSCLLHNLRYAARTLRKNPGFTAVAIITLALGIGANTAIFSVVNAVLLRPLPYKDDGRLVVILHKGRNPVSPANFLDWRSQSQVFTQMGAAEYWTPNLTGSSNPEKLWALHVSPEIFSILGVQPLLGRLFLPEEQNAGKEHEVVLSYALWQSHFGGNEEVVGRSVALSGENYTVVGVMPREFKFAPFWATKSELWAPLVLGPRLADRNGNALRVFARLKTGATIESAQAEMNAITGGLEREFPGTNQDIKVVSLREKVVGDIRSTLLVLLGAVGFVLLIACANVSHMLLARATARREEIALRSALGAGRWDIFGQFLCESLVLAVAGGVAGLLLALWSVRVLVALGPAEIPGVASIGIDSHVLWFAATASLLTALVFGMAPAWSAASINLSNAMKEGERGRSQGLRRNRLRSLLVSSEFALAVILLAGAGLMVHSFLELQRVDPGFDPHGVLSVVVSVSGTDAASHPGDFYQAALGRVRAVPGVQAAGAINHLPLAGDDWGFRFHVEGRPPNRPGQDPVATYRAVFPGYFGTMRIPLLGGRDFTDSDNLREPGVLVINEYLAEHYWPGEDAIGKRVTLDDPQHNPSWLTVVGVVKNTVRSTWAAPPEEELFVPYLQNPAYLEAPSPPFAYITLVVRTAGDPAALAPSIRAAIRSLDRDVPLSDVQTMDQAVAEANGQSRFYVVLLGAFAMTALVLSAVGIYGVMSYSVSRRTHELGVRIALGAQSRDLLKLVVLQGIVLALAGVAVGLVGALALSSLIARLLYATKPNDPTTLAAAALVLSAVAVIACYIPARRATQVDPIVALRYE